MSDVDEIYIKFQLGLLQMKESCEEGQIQDKVIEPSPHTISNSDTPKKKKAKPAYSKHQQQEEEQLPCIMNPPKPGLAYPQFLEEVNYLSIQAFQAALSDQIISNAYSKAILENKHLFENKIVLHLTEGVNCLYSIQAIQAGSKKVYCVINNCQEKQIQNILMIRELVEENGYSDVIQVMSFKNFNAEVDIIIAEPMGFCMHFDGLLDRVIQSRDLYLTKNGLIFPNLLSFKCCMIHDEYFYDQKVQFWNQVYNIPMKSMKKWMSHEPMVRVVDPTLIVSQAVKFATLSLQTVKYEDIILMKKQIVLPVLGECLSNGICIWFEADFTHGLQKIEIKGSPWFQQTKFTQVSFYRPELTPYKAGSRITIDFNGQKFPHKGYSIIKLDIDGSKYQYSFS